MRRRSRMTRQERMRIRRHGDGWKLFYGGYYDIRYYYTGVVVSLQRKFLYYFLKEWLLAASAVGLLATSVFMKRVPVISVSEVQVLFLLWMLFVSVKGLENSGLISGLSRFIERGRFVPLKLVAATFFLSMIVTNDIALVVIVPLTLSLRIDRKDLLVIMEALAANAGSAFMPFGNPQNLFIYWNYHITPIEFVTQIAPFSLFFLAVVLGLSLLLKPVDRCENDNTRNYAVTPAASLYAVMLLVVVLAVFRVVPVITGALLLAAVFAFDRKTLHVDYALLFTFLCFIGLADNIGIMLASRLKHSGHVFLLSALSSQMMSNVPAAVLFAGFTTRWRALLWGVSVGGFGNIIASFANVIAYKMYVGYADRREIAGFSVKFVCAGYVMFFLGIGLYLFLNT